MNARADADDAVPDDEPKPFLDHLEELRWTLIACFVALGIGMVIAGCAAPQLLYLLTAPLRRLGYDPQTFLRSLQVAGGFFVILRVAAWGGLLLSTPAMIYFAARFVFPGLTGREKRLLTQASGAAVLLFAGGVCLGYFVCMPIALRMMLGFHEWIDIAPEWTINDYVAFTVQMLIGFGLAFELPLVVLVLGKLGIVSSDQLRRSRKYVVIGCLVIGMLLTPSDIASQLIMAVPLYLLYELCIRVLWLDERASRRADEETAVARNGSKGNGGE